MRYRSSCGRTRWHISCDAILVVHSIVVRGLNLIPARGIKTLEALPRLKAAIRATINPLLPDGITEITVVAGAGRGRRLLINPRSEKFYWTGMHELVVQDALCEMLRPGLTFWDVGAHIGFFSLIASRILGLTGHVHAFEPVPQNAERFRRNIALNDVRNISVHEIALAASDADSVMHSHLSTLMWTLRRTEGDGNGVTVHCRTLDALAQELGPPDVIKIDVEGVECDVLRGGRRLFERGHPHLILEFADGIMPVEARNLLESYQIAKISQSHWIFT